MRTDFLSAADNTPLTKTFVREHDEIETTAYPFVRDFISTSIEVDSLAELHEAITAHAEIGACMLKGLLDRPLRNESRAGHTDATAFTNWLLLDIDFAEGWPSIDALLAELNPAWQDVSYIWQYSASAGIRAEPGLRGHLWMMLTRPMRPNHLKRWLRERNLMLPGLRQRVELTATSMGLRYPLDITACQNDRLIYIAPPVCINVIDRLEERITLVEKTHALAEPPRPIMSADNLETQTQGLLDTLRTAQGRPARTATYRHVGSEQLLTNPEHCAVTGERRARGFVYLNLNDGDSWGYYFREDRPEILWNFKGEPAVRLYDIAPDYYQRYVLERRRANFSQIEPYVFRDQPTDTYYNALYRPATDNVELLAPVGSKARLVDFLANFGAVAPKHVEDWTVTFDPTTTEVIRPKERWINRYKPTDYIRQGKTLTRPPRVPPIIFRILSSICGNDDTVLDHFLNWLACIFQTREATQTAWVFHGVQGTGKGLLFSRVLQPLFNPEHVVSWKLQNLEDKFNAPLASACFLWLDEFSSEDSKHGDLVMAKLKNLITEPELTIRGMRANPIQATSYLNVIIADNRPCPIRISEHDRRFNVAPAQERPLEIHESEQCNEVDAIADELWEFAALLAHYPADIARARRPLQNNARQVMIQASQTTIDQFFAALRCGDYTWFADYFEPDPPTADLCFYQSFELALSNWTQQLVERTGSDPSARITREDIRALYRYILGPTPAPAKFTRMCHIQRLSLIRLRIDGHRFAGLRLPIRNEDIPRAEDLAKTLAKRPFTVIQGGLHQERKP